MAEESRPFLSPSLLRAPPGSLREPQPVPCPVVIIVGCWMVEEDQSSKYTPYPRVRKAQRGGHF